MTKKAVTKSAIDFDFSTVKTTAVAKPRVLSPLQMANNAVRQVGIDELQSLSAVFKALRKAYKEIGDVLKEKGDSRAKFTFDDELANEILVQGELSALTDTFDDFDRTRTRWSYAMLTTALYRAIGATNKRTAEKVAELVAKVKAKEAAKGVAPVKAAEAKVEAK